MGRWMGVLGLSCPAGLGGRVVGIVGFTRGESRAEERRG